MKKIVFIAGDWGYTNGGINSINYDLCIALGKYNDRNYRIYCIVPFAGDNDRKFARKNNITLISLSHTSFQFPFPHSLGKYNEAQSDINKYTKKILKSIKAYEKEHIYFVGHDLVSGFIAIESKEQLLKKNIISTCVVFHHMAYKYYEGYKYEKPQTEINEKIDLQDKLFQSEVIDIAVGVGPKLTKSISEMSALDEDKIIELIPGIQEDHFKEKFSPGVFKAITFGRFESDIIKNMSLVARAFGLLLNERRGESGVEQDSTLTVIGLSDVDEETKELQKIASQGAKVNVRGLQYSKDRNALFRELIKNHVCLMLSIHEGFGLVGIEAIAAGVPLILSTNSGLFDYLSNTIPNFTQKFENNIILSGKEEEDTHVIKNLLLKVAKEKKAYKERANFLRQTLLNEGLKINNTLVGLTWENVAKDFLKKLDPIKKKSNDEVTLNNVDKDLEEIKDNFFPTDTNNYEKLKSVLNHSKSVYVAGTPGLGKTFLAKKVGLESLHEYDIVWFFDCGDITNQTEILDDAKIKESYRDFANYLFPFSNKIDGKSLKSSDFENSMLLISQIKKTLKHFSWLLIFDNACDIASKGVLTQFKKEFIPSANSAFKQHILITSRNQRWNEVNVNPFTIHTWSRNDIKKFLNFGSTRITIKKDEEYILDEFGGLPLVAKIAKEFMIKNNFTLTSYFNEWENIKSKTDLLREEVEDYTSKRSIYISVQLSFSNLNNKAQENLLKMFSFLAPDEFPIEKVLTTSPSLTNDIFKIENYSQFNNDILVPVSKYSLLTWQQERGLYSMHRIIREVIQILQTNEQERLKNNYLLITLLNNAFNKPSFKDIFFWNLLPHINEIYKFVASNYSNMDLSRQHDSALLIYKYSAFLYDTGETKEVESCLKVSQKILQNILKKNEEEDGSRRLLIDVKIKLANTLFLRGSSSKYLQAALDLALEAQRESVNDFLQQLQCKNELLAKIYQRRCEFNQSEKELKESAELIKEEKRLPNRKISHDELRGKQASINHNFGSLYWTRGIEGDYQKSECHFNESITIQEERIKESINNIQELKQDLEDVKRDLRTSPTKHNAIEDIEKKISKYEANLSNQELYEQVSRMILGAVYGLMGRFHDQEYQHSKAFKYFKDKAQEKRRFSYTAYYMLSYGWDKEICGKGKPNYAERKFNEVALLQAVYKFKPALEMDEKYLVILMILKLRLAVRFSDYTKPLPSSYKGLAIFSNKQKAQEAYKVLWKQLENMRYGNNKYYDVDTCSVSALVDYAQYLKDKGETEQFEDVKKNAHALAKNMVYHRQKELDEL